MKPNQGVGRHTNPCALILGFAQPPNICAECAQLKPDPGSQPTAYRCARTGLPRQVTSLACIEFVLAPELHGVPLPALT